jgi:hypothetical protein
MGRPQVITLVAVVAVLLLMFLLISRSKGESHHGPTTLICIDSTVSTDDVRSKYEVDLGVVVQRAAVHRAQFYAAACGANATGEVNWPVHKRFHDSYSSDALSREQLEHQADDVMEGTADSVGIDDLLEVTSHDGTPLGEMLAVTARQCEQAGGSCAIFLFTDGEWADGLLRVRDGVSEQERREYLAKYKHKLDGLQGSTVNFVGVGLGTKIGELRLAEARSIAGDLIEEASGELGFWTARL